MAAVVIECIIRFHDLIVLAGEIHGCLTVRLMLISSLSWGRRPSNPGGQGETTGKKLSADSRCTFPLILAASLEIEIRIFENMWLQ